MDSDKSQPIKIALMVIFLVGAFSLGAKLWFAIDRIAPSRLFGIASNENAFLVTTSSTIACAPIGNIKNYTLVTGTSTGRTSFIAVSNSTGTATALCRGLTCSGGGTNGATGSGIPLLPNGTTTEGIRYYEQTDAYIGPYSCSSIGTTTSTLLFYQSE